jgi:hypothetical protein
MRKKWRDLYNAMPAEQRERIEASVARQVAEMPLQEREANERASSDPLAPPPASCD